MTWATMTVVPLIFISVGSLFVSGLFYDRARAERSRSWRTVPGVIEEVRSIPKRSGAVIDIVYRYEYDGAIRRSSRIAFGQGDDGHRRPFERSAKVDDRVTVYVDPDDPSQAVLLPGAQPRDYAMPLLGLLFIVSGSWLAWWTYVKSKPQRKQKEGHV